MADYSEEIAELKAKIADLERRQAADMAKEEEIKDCYPSPITEYRYNSFSFSGSEDEEERRFAKAMDNMVQQYRLGKIPKINQYERQLLEYCDSKNMKEFLHEEFTKHPIKLNSDGTLAYSWYREHRNELGQNGTEATIEG